MARHERDGKLERAWRRHVREQRAGGGSIRAYCLSHGLAESAFYFWRRTLAERDQQRAELDRQAAGLPAFVPVRLVGSRASALGAAIDIHVQGRRVRVRPGCDRELLALVLAVLEKPAC